VADRFVLERIAADRADRSLLLVLFLLVGIGLAALFSSSYFWAQQLYGDAFRLIRRQAVYVVLGLALAFVASRVSLERLRGNVLLLLLGGLIVMVLTFVPGLGEQYLGARRWILLFGYSFQPSELIKVIVIFYLAHILSKKERQLNDTLNSIVPPMIVVGLFSAIIYLQNDFSTAVFVIGIALLMMFVARVRFRFFIGFVVVILPLTIILLLTREHRVLRILAFIDPELDRFGSGYQVLAARIALENGGAWGAGIGQSLQKYGSLPEPHSDFVCGGSLRGVRREGLSDSASCCRYLRFPHRVRRDLRDSPAGNAEYGGGLWSRSGNGHPTAIFLRRRIVGPHVTPDVRVARQRRAIN